MSAARWIRRSLAAGVLLAAGALALGGCDVITSVGPKSCDSTPEANPPVAFTEGTVDGGIYMSSAWNGNLLYFPGGMVIRFEHHLGVQPRAWQAYLAFDENGVDSHMLALAAGDQVELQSIDDQAITVKNASCSEYWILMTAQASASPAPPSGT